MSLGQFGWVDLARTKQLLFDVYHYQSADRKRPEGWVDVPSENILSLYYATYAVFAEGVAQKWDTTNAAVKQLIRKANDIATGALLETSVGRQMQAQGVPLTPQQP